MGPKSPDPKTLCAWCHTWRDSRRSSDPNVNKKSGVRHEGDLKRDPYVMLD